MFRRSSTMMALMALSLGLGMNIPALPTREFRRIPDAPIDPEDETETQRLAREKRERKNRKRVGK